MSIQYIRDERNTTTKGTNMMTMSLYKQLRDGGHEIDNHESDLYVKATPEARAIVQAEQQRLKAAGEPQMAVERFLSSVDGSEWLDIAFGFDPFWTRAEETAERIRRGREKRDLGE